MTSKQRSDIRAMLSEINDRAVRLEQAIDDFLCCSILFAVVCILIFSNWS